MRAVWKFPLALVDGALVVEMPVGARVVHVAAQVGTVTLWATVETEAPLEQRAFAIHGTGHRVATDEHYVGTAQIRPFVWHVYEVAP